MGSFLSALNPWAGVIGGGMNLLGGILGNRGSNQQRSQVLNYAYNQALPYLQGMGIPNPQQYLNPAYNSLNTFGTQVIANMGQWLPDYLAQQQNELSQFGNYGIPTLGRPTDMSAFYNSPWADVGRSYDGLTQAAMGQLGGIQSGFGGMNDILMAYLSGQNGPLASLAEVGGDLLTQRGNTGYNMNASDAAGRAISGGGWDPRFSGLYDAGNLLFSSAGMTPGLTGAYNRAAGGMDNYGMTPGIQGAYNSAMAGINSGGMTPGLSGLNQYVMSQLQGGGMTPGMSSLSNIASQWLPSYLTGPATQSSQFGPMGLSAAARLMSGNEAAPVLPNGVNPMNYASALQQIQKIGADKGYTRQNMGIMGQGSEGLAQLLARNGDIDNLNSTAMQAFSGKLPGGASADQFGDLIQQYMGQLVGGGGGGVSAGMASGAGAGGLIAMQPELEAMLKQGAEYFKNNPLLSMEQMVSMARDAAATAAAQRAEAAQRFALARGGGGAVINAGQQNQAMADFHEQALQAEAQAVREAMLKRQELGLTQQLEGAKIGIGASQADTARQGVAASRDIASANNATSASIASANNATQASATNAQLRSAALQAALQAGVQARAQEFGQSQAGLAALAQAQQIANQRGGIFSDAATKAMSDATQRYGIGVNALGNLAPIMNSNANQMQAQGTYQNQYYANRNNALSTVLDGALTGSNQALTGNNNVASILAQLGIGAEGLGNQRQLGLLGAGNTTNATGSNNLGNFMQMLTGANSGANSSLANYMQLMNGTNGISSSNIGQGLGAMQGAGGLANSALGIFGNIGNQASADQLARMGLGGNLIGQNLGAIGNFGGMLNNGLTNMNNAYGNALGMTGNLLGQQGSLWQNMFGMDFNNRQMQMNGMNQYFNNALGLGNMGGNYANIGMSPLINTVDNAWRYAGQSLNPYAQIIGGTMGMQNSQQNPWPQLSQGVGQIIGGVGGAFGGGSKPTTGYNSSQWWNPAGISGNSPWPIPPLPNFGGGF